LPRAARLRAALPPQAPSRPAPPRPARPRPAPLLSAPPPRTRRLFFFKSYQYLISCNKKVKRTTTNEGNQWHARIRKKQSPQLARHGLEHTKKSLPLLVLRSILAFSARRLVAPELTLVHHAHLSERDLLVGQVLAPLLTLLDDLDDVFIVVVHL